MTHTFRTHDLADTEELAAAAAQGVGRCVAAGLDPDVYRGWVGATVALGGRPRRLHRSQAWRTDREMLTALADLEDDITAALRQVRTAAVGIVHQRDAALDSHPPAEQLRAVVEDCDTAIGVLQAAGQRLDYALGRLRAVPEDLGDTYEALYRMVRSGRAMPHDGRWLTGTVARS